MSELTFEDVAPLAARIKAEIHKVVQGQDEAVTQLLTAFIAGGHVLLEGVPGVAKTTIARCLAASLDLSFSRVQFTPDLMPADITGVSVFDSQIGKFRFRRGPVFADFMLADEVNRAPAKTQSAMLEAMQELQATVDGRTHALSDCFMVVATQNPLEYEGVYPLPEAQLDRFLLKIQVDYPDEATELALLSAVSGMGAASAKPQTLIEKVVSGEAVRAMRALVHQVEADEAVLRYVTAIVRQSRTFASLSVGASPRAGVMLLRAAKAAALLRGHRFVRPEEVHDMAAPTLRHRIGLTPESQIDGMTPDDCVQALLKQVTVPR